MLRRWDDGLGMDMRSFDKVPVWVKLPNLHHWFRFNQMIGKIGCMIGDPICMDGVTAHNTRVDIAFVRLLVEVSVEEAKRTEAILVHSLGEDFVVPVKIEWVP